MTNPKRVWSNNKTVWKWKKWVWLQDWELKTYDWTWGKAEWQLSVYWNTWSNLSDDDELQVYDSSSATEIGTVEENQWWDTPEPTPEPIVITLVEPTGDSGFDDNPLTLPEWVTSATVGLADGYLPWDVRVCWWEDNIEEWHIGISAWLCEQIDHWETLDGETVSWEVTVTESATFVLILVPLEG